ncbi:MAG: hypothetical protein DI586_00520 [Micavibrio aeruginosavorus]|uniref:Uncharacterized protein n=1 Tax=Micavibrio aeruginosavorus TaxID=349221 RepID=A0A2W5FQY0_9BACT|nr:MAG: hypothetical protein DI586_00520 [Micavibrio aeruginosavorus]
MKAFDLIDSASFGYKTVWQERKYLLKLAFVPVFIKLACTVIIFAFDFQNNFLRQALITLPASFAEGWLLAQFLRTLILLERWPIMLPEDVSDRHMSALLLRARGIMSSTIMFVLITLAAYGLKEIYAMFYDMAGAGEATKNAEAPPGNPLLFIPAMILIFLSIYAFRYLWLYIPVVVLMPMGEFLRKLGGFMASIKMMGVFLVAMVPCFVLAMVVSTLLTSLVGGPDSDIGRFVMVMVSVVIETLISLITTASIVYALRDILPKHPLALADINKE